MERKNYNYILSILFLSLVIIFSCGFNQSEEVRSRYDVFVSDYTNAIVYDTIVSQTFSEHRPSDFYNKRFETEQFTYYYGRLVPDAFFEDHINNVVSSERNEIWSLLLGIDKYERYDIDSNQVFHEVLLDDVLIGYYLKEDSVKRDVEIAFGRFLKAEFGYQVTSSFPVDIFE